MAKIGSHVLYRALAAHHTVTVETHKGAVHVHEKSTHEVAVNEKGEPTETVKHHGSVHHRELREFAGLVTRTHKDGTADLVIFPPGKAPTHVERVKEGGNEGEFETV